MKCLTPNEQIVCVAIVFVIAILSLIIGINKGINSVNHAKNENDAPQL